MKQVEQVAAGVGCTVDLTMCQTDLISGFTSSVMGMQQMHALDLYEVFGRCTSRFCRGLTRVNEGYRRVIEGYRGLSRDVEVTSSRASRHRGLDVGQVWEQRN